ncbi:hypothetical protein BFP70_08355 [Thioclava sp. SK-1]|uniref:lipid A-modifier LpxR family protein n=1 Tax=Thioclava sp. SK-1 TaxID=1889770 RepID=UPI000826C627|nr:lipid A-modifier LpxR family protein [Thioclava sp. SK-1]OCX66111.1 hypothetical protein BFP70_08355 [Thioclava sp. SK-1]
MGNRIQKMVSTLAVIALTCPGVGLAQDMGGAAIGADVDSPQGRHYLGWTRFVANDVLFDGQDRWRTGAIHVSVLHGYDFDGDLPQQPFGLMEYRFGGEIIAPSNLEDPAPDDRRYVSKVDLAAISHFQWQGFASQIGAGVTAIGPDTPAWRVQERIHDWFNQPEPIAAQTQLGNQLFPTLIGEMRRDIAVGQDMVLQPFVSARVAEEDVLRAGVDMQIGQMAQDVLWLRDDVTGFLHPGLEGASVSGVGFTLGMDMTHVFDSDLFPAADGLQYEDMRYRARAGVTLQVEEARIFYGASYLSEEYKGQPEGQVVGALQLDLSF